MSLQSNWDNLFDKSHRHFFNLQDAYKSQGMRDIEGFLESICDFKRGGTSAQQKIADELESLNVYRQNVALRIALEIYNSSVLKDVSHRILSSHSRGFYRSNLIQLWGAVEPPHTYVIQYVKDDNPLRFPLIQGILSKYSKATEKLALELLETDEDAIKEVVIRCISSWGNIQILWDIIEKFPHVDDIDWWASDHRSEIAFQLALQGQQEAIQILETALLHENQLIAVQASIRLAWLAIPTTIKKLRTLAKSESGDVVALVLDAVSGLKSGSLINELVMIAESSMTAEMSSVPLADEAIRVLRYILGDSGNPEKYVDGLLQETYANDYRLSKIEFYRSLSEQLDSSKRYCGGDLLTLQHLWDELLSPHEGRVFSALSNLRAISGQTFGFDLGKDIIANYSAVKAWNEYISQANFYVPGEWYYFGKPFSNTDA